MRFLDNAVHCGKIIHFLGFPFYKMYQIFYIAFRSFNRRKIKTGDGKTRFLCGFPVRVAGRCGGGDVTALSCFIFDPMCHPLFLPESRFSTHPTKTPHSRVGLQGRSVCPSAPQSGYTGRTGQATG